MATAPVSEKLFIDGPVGRLESILDEARDGPIRGCAVVCHPHPQHGGTMHNKVAHTLARAFVRQGYRSLRFNFRGTEASEGRYDEGVGELDDALAAIEWMQADQPQAPVWLAGFSFGAAIAVRVAVAVEVRLAQPEAGALAGATRKWQGRAATKEDVEMVVVNLRVVAHRRRAKERAGFGAGVRANPGFGRVIQRRKDYALLMQGYNSRRSVELPAVWPNAGFIGKVIRDRRRALAGRQTPPFRLGAEMCLREGSGSRPGLRDARP